MAGLIGRRLARLFGGAPRDGPSSVVATTTVTWTTIDGAMSALGREVGVSVASRPDETPPTGTTTTTYVAEQIRNRIVLGILPPGSKVRVYELAEELGISRVPLREAVRELEAESLVDNLPRRGTIVRQLSEQDLRDSFALLRRIEPIAARRAAAAPDGDVAREMRHWLKELRRLHRRRVARVSEEVLHAHRQFHFAMFAVSGDGVLQRHLGMLWNTCERYVMMSLPDRERQRAADREHARLVEAIAAGDPDLAVRALDDHLDNSLASCLSRLAGPATSTG